jgi:hypothetical protein
MRTLWKWAVVLAVPAIWVASAWPQQPAHHAEGTTVKLLLLRQKSVQKELGISDDVVKKIMAFTNEQAEAAHKILESPDAQHKAAFEKLAEKNKKFLADTLNAKQNTRLEQLFLQFTAPYQLTTPEVAKALNLTADQQQKFKDLHAEYQKELTEILFGTDIKGRGEKFAKLRDKTRDKIQSILTDKQQAQAREAVGPPFTGEIVFEKNELVKKK